MFITELQANSAPATGGFDVMAFMPLILIFGIFYFLILRPQQKKAKVHQQLLASLSKGDRVVTSGGLIGVISKVISDQEIEVEIASDVKVKVLRAMVAEVMSKPNPVVQAKQEDAEDGDAKKTKVVAKKNTKSVTKK